MKEGEQGDEAAREAAAAAARREKRPWRPVALLEAGLFSALRFPP